MGARKDTWKMRNSSIKDRYKSQGEEESVECEKEGNREVGRRDRKGV